MTSRTIVISAAVLIVAVWVGVQVRGVFGQTVVHAPSTTRPSVSPLDFKVTDIDGKPVDLGDYRGKVVMLVNVASRCGFTPQYKDLETLYKADQEKGLVIVGFPANNFGGQEPGSDEQIKQFCSAKYDVTFPMMSKVSVKGSDKCPLYKFLTEPTTAGDFAGEIGWNFTKFVVDRQGAVVARFPSKTKPTDPAVTAAIDAALNAH